MSEAMDRTEAKLLVDQIEALGRAPRPMIEDFCKQLVEDRKAARKVLDDSHAHTMAMIDETVEEMISRSRFRRWVMLLIYFVGAAMGFGVGVLL